MNKQVNKLIALDIPVNLRGETTQRCVCVCVHPARNKLPAGEHKSTGNVEKPRLHFYKNCCAQKKKKNRKGITSLLLASLLLACLSDVLRM